MALRVLSVVGARPQFVKAAMVSRAIAESGGRVSEEIVHTGQHYDRAMSAVFFEELGIPEPAANLEIGSGPHGDVTGRMLAGLEAEIVKRRPDWTLVYGDTNSTLAGALASAKLNVPAAHVEAGLRSFNRRMPEEVNRVLADHASTLLLCPTRTAVANLAREGVTRGVVRVGDVMYDAALRFGEIARTRSAALARLGLRPKGYALATVHRAENTDDPARLEGILRGLAAVARETPVAFPIHPRTRERIARFGLERAAEGVLLADPVPFLDMARLEQEARLILTDSGGVQKEAYFHGVPCVTLRDETEWTETVEAGWNALAGADPERIAEAARRAGPGRPIEEYGGGRAAEAIVRALLEAAGG